MGSFGRRPNTAVWHRVVQQGVEVLANVWLIPHTSEHIISPLIFIEDEQPQSTQISDCWRFGLLAFHHQTKALSSRDVSSAAEQVWPQD